MNFKDLINNISKSKLAGLLVVLVLITGYHFLIVSRGIKKVGVVQMDKLVYEYKGMKDATQLFTGKVTDWSTQADSIKKILEDYLYDIKMDSINGDNAKLEVDQQKFMLLKGKYIEYQQKTQENSQVEDQKMTVGVINQLKEHMKHYAEENNFDLIITNTQSENVGYVKEKFDVTADLLEYANLNYEGEK